MVEKGEPEFWLSSCRFLTKVTEQQMHEHGHIQCFRSNFVSVSPKPCSVLLSPTEKGRQDSATGGVQPFGSRHSIRPQFALS